MKKLIPLLLILLFPLLAYASFLCDGDDYLVTAANGKYDSVQDGSIGWWYSADAGTYLDSSVLTYGTTSVSTRMNLFFWDKAGDSAGFSIEWKNANGSWYGIYASALGPGNLTDGQPHLCIISSDGTNRNTLYLDGVNLTTDTYDIPANGAQSDWFGDTDEVGSYSHHISIGASKYSATIDGYVNGTIHEFFITDDHINETEALAIYNARMRGVPLQRHTVMDIWEPDCSSWECNGLSIPSVGDGASNPVTAVNGNNGNILINLPLQEGLEGV